MASFSRRNVPAGLVIAQAIGITASGYLLGQNAGLSLNAVPAIMQAPAPLAAKQWFTILNNGGFYAIRLAIISALATGYVAYNQDPSTLPFKLNVAATILLPSIVPFTLTFIVPTNNKLEARMRQLESTTPENKAVEADSMEAETTYALIDRWGVLNLARTALIAAGFFSTLVAALDKRLTVLVVPYSGAVRTG